MFGAGEDKVQTRTLTVVGVKLPRDARLRLAETSHQRVKKTMMTMSSLAVSRQLRGESTGLESCASETASMLRSEYL